MSNQPTRLECTASTLSLISAGLPAWLYIKPRSGGLAKNLISHGLKSIEAAPSPIISIARSLGAALASPSGRPVAGAAREAGAPLAAGYVKRVTTLHDSFDQTFDMVTSQLSAPAQTVLYDVEEFWRC